MITGVIKSTTLLLLTLTLTTGCIIHVGGDKRHDNNGGAVSSVFGNLEVGEGKQVADVSSVNGNLTIHDHAEAEDVDSVNGNIKIGKHVTVDSVEAVNGSIQTGQYFNSRGSISTVNGNIAIQANSTIGDDISTLNGDITLNNVQVASDVSTRNGNIELSNNSIIDGDIIFEAKDEDSWGRNNNRHKLPLLVIDASSTVKGRIILKQKVRLDIQNTALNEKVEYRYQEE